MSAREEMLGRVRGALARGAAEREAGARARISARARNLVPARAKGDPKELVARFVAEAQRAAATVLRAADPDAAVDMVADYLRRENLGFGAAIAPDPWLLALPWARAPMLEARRGPAIESDRVSITSAFAGIAETGTLLMRSSVLHPATLNFAPPTHIVVLAAARIVSGFEDAFDRLAAEPDGLPATANLITGPSRSADIEQTILMGAHGPQRLTIVLIGDGA